MRVYQKALVSVAAVSLAVTTAACSSSGTSSSSSPTPVGQFKTLTGQGTTVVLDPTFIQAVTALKVTPSGIGTAKVALPDITFPITGGNATIYKKGAVTPYVQGEIDHNGSGLQLVAGGHTVKLTNFVVDPGNNSNLKGNVNIDGTDAGQVKLFDLDGSTLQTPTIDASTGIATLQGTTIYLSTDAAAALNKTFGITALKGGDKTGTKIGTAIIKATGK